MKCFFFPGKIRYILKIEYGNGKHMPIAISNFQLLYLWHHKSIIYLTKYIAFLVFELKYVNEKEYANVLSRHI